MGSLVDVLVAFRTPDIEREQEVVLERKVERLGKRITQEGGEEVSLHGFYVVENVLCGAWDICGEGYGSMLSNQSGKRTLFKYPERARQAARETKSYFTSFQKKYVFDEFRIVESRGDFWRFPDGQLFQLSTGDSVRLCDEPPEDFFLFNRLERKISTIGKGNE